MMCRVLLLVVCVAGGGMLVGAGVPSHAQEVVHARESADAHAQQKPVSPVQVQQRADEAIARGLMFLKSTQDGDGAWSPQVGPAVTGLVLTAMLDAPTPGGAPGSNPALGSPPTPGSNAVTGSGPAAGLDDPHARKALAYILSMAQPDGSIRSGPDGILANYNTAICLSALSRVPHEPGVAPVIAAAQRFLKGLQWQPGMHDAQGNAITEAHPFFGGAGYGKHGRPDLSNTQFMIQALHDSGVPRDDPAWARAMVFISRLQGTETNTFFAPGTIVPDGGVIYATSVNKDLVGVPQSMANPEQVDEARAGRPVSGLRGYGTMTYAAFKSYLYADLAADDPRVLAALAWIGQNYTLDANPGMPEKLREQGLYYYYLTQARALAAFGEPMLQTQAGPVDWAANLVEAVADRQRDDGSWSNPADRWMEGDPNLVTAYSVLALQNARESLGKSVEDSQAVPGK